MVELDKLFPKLRKDNHQITSPKNDGYNCIAWAAGYTTRWWWPGDPETTFWLGEREETLASFRFIFLSLGFSECDLEISEPGFEKIALFVDLGGIPTHAARQLPIGRWSSKLGLSEDIEHNLKDLEGIEYGKVALVLRKPTL
jgi:hypothetical protein